MLGAGRVGSDEGQVDVGLEGRRQLNLGLLSSLTDTLDGHAVAGQVDAGLGLELLDEVADKLDVKVLTTEMGVTVCALDLEDAVLDLQNGNIEGTTAKIVNGDDPVSLLLQTVGQGGSGGLVDDTEDVETSDLTSILSGLALRIVEVSGHGHDGVLDGLAEIGLGRLLHLAEHETTNLRGRVVLAASSDPGVAIGVLDDLVRNLLEIPLDLSVAELATYESLGGEEGVLGVDNGLTLGGDTDETFAIFGERNY